MQRVHLNGLSLATSPSDAIAAEDLLTVTIATGLAGEEPLPLQVRVSQQGAVDIPLIGPVTVAGLEPAAGADQIASAAIARGVYVRPQVNLEVAEQATHRITVLGAVGEPGVKKIPRAGCDVLNAIAAAGGLTEDAGAVVELLRGDSFGLADASPAAAAEGIQQVAYEESTANPKAEVLDLANPSGMSPQRMQLSDRDVIIVRPREQRVVHVTGLVANPAQFDLMEEHDLRVLDALAMAGGVTTTVADKVLVVRQLPDQPEPAVIQISISRAKTDGAENLMLKSGDLVSVESTPATVALETFKNLFRITMGVGSNLTLF